MHRANSVICCYILIYLFYRSDAITSDNPEICITPDTCEAQKITWQLLDFSVVSLVLTL